MLAAGTAAAGWAGERRGCWRLARPRLAGPGNGRGCWRLGAGADPDAGGPALVRPPLVLAHAAPDAGVLAALDRPLQAGFHHRTAPAHLFGFVDLEKGGPRVADREEQLRIHLTAGGVMAPVHAGNSSSTAGLVARICPALACE